MAGTIVPAFLSHHMQHRTSSFHVMLRKENVLGYRSQKIKATAEPLIAFSMHVMEPSFGQHWGLTAQIQASGLQWEVWKVQWDGSHRQLLRTCMIRCHNRTNSHDCAPCSADT